MRHSRPDFYTAIFRLGRSLAFKQDFSTDGHGLFARLPNPRLSSEHPTAFPLTRQPPTPHRHAHAALLSCRPSRLALRIVPPASWR